ncbi:MAG: ribonuclease D, partial [Alphaproteobacteria bacterium]|nr:ribonuclease D [Alphaproteobacteria bacterium]
ITVDTEFLRDRTFWPKLCLLQFATPEEARAVDPLADGIDLTPIFEVLRDSRVTKVFHAARQDLEIFYHQMGEVPGPIFDTQLAAMVAGYGDSVGYETLVNKIAKAQIDKASQYTDWARRPLKERQLSYALADVTHLRTVYDSLSRQLESSGRSGWLDEEMAILTDPGTYQMDVDEAWRRLKIRHRAPRYLAVLKAVAAWREERAQTRDVPRNRILRDEVVQQLASEQPTSLQALGEIRGLPKELKRGAVAEALLKTIEEALAMPEGALPTLAPANRLPRDIGPVVDLLKVLLKAVSEKHGVAQKLIATVADLERIAADDAADVAALKGWRRKIFGDEALALKHGRLALTVSGRRLATVTLADSD